MKLIRKDDDLIIHSLCKINEKKSKYVSKSGEEKHYYRYDVTIPMFLVEFIDNEDNIVYFYTHDGKIYLSTSEPSPLLQPQKRKILKHYNSKRIALPKQLFSFDDENAIDFVVHMKKEDIVSGKCGLIELRVV